MNQISSYQPYVPINAWAEDDRPREKMLRRGRQQLSDAELLAILLGSGSRQESAVDLARRLLHACDNNIHQLSQNTIGDLTKFKGVGPAKAVTILAALELGRRRQLSEVQDRPIIHSSADAYKLLGPTMADLNHEEFWILLLNRANRVIGKWQVSSGGTTGTVVDANIIFRKALEEKALGIILSHNHPSGNSQPSAADRKLTKKLCQAGASLSISVLDHLIITDHAYYSFVDEGEACMS